LDCGHTQPPSPPLRKTRSDQLLERRIQAITSLRRQAVT
jgi:hypothetical protein